MQKTSRKPTFWTVLAMVNVVAMMYPVHMYVNADSNDQQIFALIMLLGIGFVLAVVDSLSVLGAYL